MAEASFGKTVKVHYSVKLDDGTVVDNTFDHEPFLFTIGLGQAIPGFEDAVISMIPGTSKTVKLPVEEAYGPYNKELVTEVDRSEFPADFVFEAGQQLELSRIDGGFDLATVLKVSEKTVTLDRNHPMAGKELTIDIQLLEIT